MARPNALPIDDLVQIACGGNTAPLDELLLRRGGVPGPRPNHKLAITVAWALFAQGKKGRHRLETMRALDEHAAPPGSAYPILTMVGVLGLGCEAATVSASADRKAALDRMQPFAEDPRFEVREAVTQALGLCLKEHPAEVLAQLQNWSDGYFHAELMLRAMTEPAILQQFDDVRLPLSRLQESFALAANAPRAHQRSQGYRALLKTMTQALVELGKRFPHPVAQWIEENAEVATKDLLGVLNNALDGLRSGGFRPGDAQAVRDALNAVVPPPRDPRWNVGPTRERGSKARKKGRGKR